MLKSYKLWKFAMLIEFCNNFMWDQNLERKAIVSQSELCIYFFSEIIYAMFFLVENENTAFKISVCYFEF